MKKKNDWDYKGLLKKLGIVTLFILVGFFLLAFVWGFVSELASFRSYDKIGWCYSEEGADVIYECDFRVTGVTEY